MESQQAVRSHGQGYEHDPNMPSLHSVAEGEDHGEHHEKKSVMMLKKVKAKAKKLKDTITKHGHDRQEGHIPDDRDLDEEDDEGEDEEMVEDPGVHGAPAHVYDTAAVKSTAPGIVPVPERPKGADKDPNPMLDTRQRLDAAGEFKGSQNRPMAEHGGVMPTDELLRTPANTPQSVAPSPGKASGVAIPERTFVHEASDQSKINLKTPTRLEADPDAPGKPYKPSNYETKVMDPAGSGGHEANIAPVSQALGAMHIRDNPEVKPSQVSVPSALGSHDQFSPELITGETKASSMPVEPEKSHIPAGAEGDQKGEMPSSPGSYTAKISTATGMVADKAIAAKNILTSKLGYGTSPTTEVDAKDKPSGDQSPRQSGYTEKITSATYVIADKAALAKNLVASKIGYGQKEDQTSHETEQTEQPVDRTSDQSSYTGKIAAAAGTAKDVVASKLGYGKRDDAASHEMPEGETGVRSASVEELGKKAPGQDKGVTVKTYLAEKLKPGEEDMALSDVISSALDTRKKAEDKPVVVTESEEVRHHLGEGNGKEGQLNSPGKGMVDKLKGAVGSWLGKTGDPNAHQSHGTETVASAGADTVKEEHIGGRRLQESMS